MANITERKAKFTQEIVDKLAAAIATEFDTDVFFTGENLNTISISCGEFDGKEVFGSFKFTLHKANWNLYDEIEKYEAFRTEKELKAKVNAQKKAEKLKKAEEQKAKAAAREAQKQKDINKRKANISSMQENLAE